MVQWERIHLQNRRPLGWEDALEEENGNPLQYSCLKNLMDREAWQAAQGGKDLDKTEATEHTLSCSG